jgi:transcription-repair coupling factor (superfamily II helicase)
VAALDLAEIIAKTKEAFLHHNDMEFVGLREVHIEFILSALVSLLQQSSAGQPEARALWLVLEHEKDCNAWENFLIKAHALADHGNETLEILKIPHFDVWGVERYSLNDLVNRERVKSLARLCYSSLPKIILTTVEGLAQKTLQKEQFLQSSVLLNAGKAHDLDELIFKLQDLGYQEVDMVSEPGFFAVRGNIVDVFSFSAKDPVRLQFGIESLESIRLFSFHDQRSFRSLDELGIGPSFELILSKERKKEDAQLLYDYLLEQPISQLDREGFIKSFQSGAFFSDLYALMPVLRRVSGVFLDYAGQNDAFLFVDAALVCEEKYLAYLKNINIEHDIDQTNSKFSVSPGEHFIEYSELMSRVRHHPVWQMRGRIAGREDVCGPALTSVPTLINEIGQAAEAKEFSAWLKVIQKILKEKGGVVIVLGDTMEYVGRIQSLFNQRKIMCQVVAEQMDLTGTEKLNPGMIYLAQGFCSDFVLMKNETVLVLPAHLLLGVSFRKKKTGALKLKDTLQNYSALKKGSYVVHVEHGIARFDGLQSLVFNDVKGDFLLLQFAGTDKLYLPVDRLGLLQSYMNADLSDSAPALDKLKGRTWEKRQNKAKQAAKDLSEKLLALQAQRKIFHRTPYSIDSEIFTKFEADFPYEETPDQLQAIEDVYRDFAKVNPMDRLICGDVGLGKTEVALRATMRVVLDGFQVLVLVPTTVLCFQHYRTFYNRLNKHGVVVEQLNRLVGGKATERVLAQFNAGKIDVLVGTHRALSPDVNPHRLGLLVVDEEQRFGVEHKEKIKEMSAGIDILTLTATPIPRTLHMSMLGLRDISIMTTAPEERLPIKTYISPFDRNVIKNALEREIRRGGQVYFLHNRVDEIEGIAAMLRSLVPDCELRTAHGQMAAGQLEKIFIDFLEKKFSILVCTTIIESGIDLPNVNTIIVNRADKFGLSQLYQIRGRVGRSSRQSYAIFLVPEEKSLSVDARRRLEILLLHQELGAGFAVSRFDLEMRGAGNFLGVDQSGHINEVGIEYYTELLAKAISDLKTKNPERLNKPNTELKIPVMAVIPSSFVKSEEEKLKLYRRLFSIESISQLEELKHTVVDQYGALPLELVLLFKISELKYYLVNCFVASIVFNPGPVQAEIFFGPLDERLIGTLVNFVTGNEEHYVLTQDYRLILLLGDKIYEEGKLLEVALLDRIISLIYPLYVEFSSIYGSDNG